MTMKIEVTIPEDDVRAGKAAAYLADAMSAIGFNRVARDGYAATVLSGDQPISPDAEVLPDEGPNYAAMKEAADAPPVNIGRPATAEEAATVTESAVAESPKRERGKPAPGKARRTKEEIAEDEAADAAEAAAAPAQEAKPAIPTGEERIGPATAEDAAQDAEDEAAEAAAQATTTLTHDDVRAALKKYVDAYGMPAAMEDGPKVFKMLFGDNAVKVSDVPTDQASLQKAIDGIGEMLAKNPFKREAQL